MTKSSTNMKIQKCGSKNNKRERQIMMNVIQRREMNNSNPVKTGYFQIIIDALFKYLVVLQELFVEFKSSIL